MTERNAIILAAGMASRFVPLSAECPKGLLEVNDEVVIERQIRQLREAGVKDITIVVGYKAEMFEYLKEKYSVEIVLNEDYARYNNTSSVIRVLDRLQNTYICSSDNYFPRNVFVETPKESYYSALYAQGETTEYCMKLSHNDDILDVTVGGRDAWYMIGHVFFNEAFSKYFRELMLKEYEKDETRQGYWEDVYRAHIDELPKLKIHRYREGEIYEFDSLDELRQLDPSYIEDTRSKVIKSIARQLECKESVLTSFTRIKHDGNFVLFSFMKNGQHYIYDERLKSAQKQ